MADTSPGDGPGAKLKRYWAFGEGAAKIKWNTPGDFQRCVRELRGNLAGSEGYCNVVHPMATGHPPGKH